MMLHDFFWSFLWKQKKRIKVSEICAKKFLPKLHLTCAETTFHIVESLMLYAPINVMPAGGKQCMGWGFDCLWPWGRAFEWSCSPRGGDIWTFLRPTWRYLTADSDEKKKGDRTYVSRFHASRMRRTVWKDLEIMEANENKRKLSGFHCFVFKFRLF